MKERGEEEREDAGVPKRCSSEWDRSYFCRSMVAERNGGRDRRAVLEGRENPAQLEEEKRGEKTAVCLIRAASAFERVKPIPNMLLDVSAHALNA